MGKLGRAIVTGLGTGYLPGAPGTWGSAVAAGLLWLAAAGFQWRALPVAICAAALAATAALLCGLLGGAAERHWGRPDPGAVTLDEWAGQAVALIGVPLAVPNLAPAAGAAVAVGIAFVAFRTFDIVKPPPVRQLERLPGGWGIAADDLAAGAYANLVAQVVLRWRLGA